MKFKMKYELNDGEKGCVDLKATNPEAANEEAERFVSERPEVCGYTVVEAKERTSLRHKNIVTKKNVKPNNNQNNQNKENKKMKKTKMTPEEAKEARRQSAKRYYEKKRAAKMAMNGGADPKRRRPLKKTADTVAAEKPAAPRKTAKRAMCDKSCKACTCGKAKLNPEQKHLIKLEKYLAKSVAKYASIKEKLAAQKAEIDKIKSEIKEAKALVKACKAANKAFSGEETKTAE